MYAQIKDNKVVKYPYIERNLREDNPLVSFPKDALSNKTLRDEYSIVEVLKVEAPEKRGFNPVEEDPSFDGVSWIQNWKHELKHPSQVMCDEITPEVAPPITDGRIAVAAPFPEYVNGEWTQTWIWEDADYSVLRSYEYGEPHEQLEFIAGNGLDAWQARVAEIKTKYPKP